jgi:hypothetical protein
MLTTQLHDPGLDLIDRGQEPNALVWIIDQAGVLGGFTEASQKL